MKEPIRPIRNAADHAAALAEIDLLFAAVPGSAEADRLEVLAVLVAEYERSQEAMVHTHPIDVLNLSMKAQGRTQADLAALLGSRSRASEVLARRRRLSTTMVEKLAQAWSIPASLLSAPYAARSRMTKALRIGAVTIVSAVVLSAAAIGGAFYYYGANLPNTAQIAATFVGSRMNDPGFTPMERISSEVIKAFLAAEDVDFYAHGGYSFTAIVRAAGHTLISGKPQGGSTITQQLAKNALLNEGRSFDRKIKEIILARRIEQALTKDRILEAYFNRVYFGGEAYGIAAAASRYFGKPPFDLTIAEAAYLAGLLSAPNTYRLDVSANLGRAKARRDWVLRRMADEGLITASAAHFASAEPLMPINR